MFYKLKFILSSFCFLCSMFSVRQYCSAEERVLSYKNPLLDNSGLPKFREIQAKHVVPGLTKVLQDVEKQLESLEVKLSGSSSPNVVSSFCCITISQLLWCFSKHRSCVASLALKVQFCSSL